MKKSFPSPFMYVRLGVQSPDERLIVAKSKKSALKSVKSVAKVAPVSDETVMALEESERTEVTTAETKIRDLKLLVADLAMEEAVVQARRNRALQMLQEAQQELMETVRKIAESHGIDPDGDPANGRWTLNTASMEFSRQ